jgi:hypothetical protein
MPILVFVYFTQFLDKNILGYAAIMDFPITGIHYNDVAQAFYMGMHLPSIPSPSAAFTNMPRLPHLDVSHAIYRPKIPTRQISRRPHHCLGLPRHAARRLPRFPWLLRFALLPRHARSLRQPDVDSHG